MPVPKETQDALEHGREGFTYREDGEFAGATGSSAVGLYRLKVIQNALAFEIKTGIKMTRASTLKAANQSLGTNFKRKQHALDAINALLAEYGEGTV